ncbi:hypothetical protein EV360DRAFT_76309 [Lentinula raphanica]|nr:hypothetical protein EV360DRAFT_76309 [Lentinula raphanica]
MASRMSSRLREKPSKNVVPKSLIPKTRKEQATQRKEKENQKEAERKAEEAKKQASRILVAQQLDEQAEQDLSVLRPDLTLSTSDSESIGLSNTAIEAEPEAPQPMVIDVVSPEEESDSEVKHLEEILAKKREQARNRKAKKTLLRDEIAAARKASPNPLVPTERTSKGRKHFSELSESETTPLQSKKRSKVAEIGGLTPTWKTAVYGSARQNRARVSTSSIDNDKTIESDSEIIGEFAGDESKEAVESQRAAKSHKNMTSKAVVDVKLEPVDVNLVAKEECATGKPAQPPKNRGRVQKSHVPFVNVSDQNVWNNLILPALIEWTSARKNQFSINADPELRSVVRALWITHLGPLLPPNCEDVKGNSIPRCEHPAILAYAQTQLRTYRSTVGKTATRIVSEYIGKNGGDSVLERASLVKDLLSNDAFVYEEPGSTRALSKGAFRGELLMRTFAFYVSWALSAPKSSDSDSFASTNPAGALALTATAIKWALSLWETGNKSTEANGDEEPNAEEVNATSSKKHNNPQKKNLPRNNPNSFGERWSVDCNKFQDSAKNLVDAKWDLIFAATEAYLFDIPNAGAGPALKDMRKSREVEPLPSFSMSTEQSDDVIVLSD